MIAHQKAQEPTKSSEREMISIVFMCILYLMRRGGSSGNRDFFHGDIPHTDQASEVGEEGSKLRRIALNKLDTRVGIVESVGFHGITKERGEESGIGHLFHASIIHSV